jgi:hypothetical protein
MINPEARKGSVASVPVRWRRLSLAQKDVSDLTSAGHGRTEDIVVPELKFRDVQ